MRSILPEIVRAECAPGAGVVIACEHASAFIPDEFADLGLAPAARLSHIAWDPGALDIALRLSALCAAPLIAGSVSRLVYDCNRPPEAPDAIPARSEVFDVPGNRDILAADRAARAAAIHAPFHGALSNMLAAAPEAALVTVHSFTPVWHGRRRDFTLGVLHDSDARLADALLVAAADLDPRRNAPYGPEDGVTHTLKLHALETGRLNVMLEIRSDVIVDTPSAHRFADDLAPRLLAAIRAAS
ncbi:MAG: N-formylglutamate amidohydrolase [Paracoccaceae bacterium]